MILVNCKFLCTICARNGTLLPEICIDNTVVPSPIIIKASTLAMISLIAFPFLAVAKTYEMLVSKYANADIPVIGVVCQQIICSNEGK